MRKTPESIAMHVMYDAEWIDQAITDLTLAIIDMWVMMPDEHVSDLSPATRILAQALYKEYSNVNS
jgi:hypothetical protein